MKKTIGNFLIPPQGDMAYDKENRKLFQKSIPMSKGNYSARHADLQEDGSVFLYWKSDKSIKITPASFTIAELEEIVRQAKKIHNT